MSTLYNLSARRLDGSELITAEFKGKVLLFVNLDPH
jgi:glutathione peroxidase-family protein